MGRFDAVKGLPWVVSNHGDVDTNSKMVAINSPIEGPDYTCYAKFAHDFTYTQRVGKVCKAGTYPNSLPADNMYDPMSPDKCCQEVKDWTACQFLCEMHGCSKVQYLPSVNRCDVMTGCDDEEDEDSGWEYYDVAPATPSCSAVQSACPAGFLYTHQNAENNCAGPICDKDLAGNLQNQDLATCCAACGGVVLSIDNLNTGGTQGKYFNFKMGTAAAQYGDVLPTSDVTDTEVVAVQCRDGVQAWTGAVYVWAEATSYRGCCEDTNVENAYGRRARGSAEFQWQIGDIVSFGQGASCDCGATTSLQKANATTKPALMKGPGMANGKRKRPTFNDKRKRRFVNTMSRKEEAAAKKAEEAAAAKKKAEEEAVAKKAEEASAAKKEAEKAEEDAKKQAEEAKAEAKETKEFEEMAKQLEEEEREEEEDLKKEKEEELKKKKEDISKEIKEMEEKIKKAKERKKETKKAEGTKKKSKPHKDMQHEIHSNDEQIDLLRAENAEMRRKIRVAAGAK